VRKASKERPVSPVNGVPLPIGKPFTKGDPRAKECQEKGTATKRVRKTLREELLYLLSDGQTQTSLSVALINEGLKGNTRAYEIIRDTIGEKPVEKVAIADVEQSVIDEVESAVLGESISLSDAERDDAK
jgi:hypothetical protein